MRRRFQAVVWILGAAIPAQAVSLKDIRSWVERGEVRSVEEVVRKLPPDMRSRFVLMERSRSLQQASPQAPRAILYGDRAGLVVSFNGAPGHRGYGSIEAIELDPSGLSYEMRSFDFTGATPHISPPNPEICLRCHRALPRHSWEPYPYWPGALGEGPKFSAEERRRLETFSASAGSHPLYRHLDFSRVKSRDSTPAFELYALVTEQNLRRAPALIAASTDYARYRPALLGALADCPEIASWAPELEKNAPWESVRQDTLRRFQKLPAPYQRILTSAVPSVVAKLRYLLESRGFPVDVLPNSFTDRFFLTAPGTVIPQLLARMPGLPPNAPMGALSAYFQPGTRPYGPIEKKAHSAFCQDLKREMP